jgi:hypothetical protein
MGNPQLIKDMEEQLMGLTTANDQLRMQVVEKEGALKRIEDSFRERQIQASKDLEAKENYIRQLEQIVKTNQFNVS